MTLRPVIVGTIALTLLAAGCTNAPGASTPPAVTGTPDQLVSAAAGRTQAARTASVDLRLAQTGSGLPGGPINTVDTATGAVDFATQASVLTFSGPATTLGGAPIQLVTSGGKVYVDAQAVGGAPGGYVEDTGQLPKPTSSNGSATLSLDPSQFKGFAPSQLLSGLANLHNVRKAATATIGGMSASEYVSTFTSTGSSPFGTLSTPPGSGGSFPPPTLNVWLDALGRVVQISSTIDLTSLVRALVTPSASATGGGPKLTVTVQHKLSRWGGPVTIPSVAGGSTPATSNPPTSATPSTSPAASTSIPGAGAASCLVRPSTTHPTVGSRVDLRITGAPPWTAVRGVVTRVNGAITTLTGQTDASGSALLSFTVGQDRVGAPLPVQVIVGTASCSTSIQPVP